MCFPFQMNLSDADYYRPWSEQEKQQLLYFVERNRSKTVVKWNHYKNDIKGKTVIQAKSYYNNILKFNKSKNPNKFGEDELISYIYLFTLKGYSIEQLRQHFSYKNDAQFNAMREHLQGMQQKLAMMMFYILKHPDAEYEYDKPVLNLFYKAK